MWRMENGRLLSIIFESLLQCILILKNMRDMRFTVIFIQSVAVIFSVVQ